MDETQQALVDKRYPPTHRDVRIFIAAYPIIVVGGAGWFRDAAWFWWVAVFCAIGWLGAAWQFLANTHRREGYGAAIEDVTHRTESQRFQEDMLAGRIPLKKRADL